jgi:hypothetical protein
MAEISFSTIPERKSQSSHQYWRVRNDRLQAGSHSSVNPCEQSADGERKRKEQIPIWRLARRVDCCWKFIGSWDEYGETEIWEVREDKKELAQKVRNGDFDWALHCSLHRWEGWNQMRSISQFWVNECDSLSWVRQSASTYDQQLWKCHPTDSSFTALSHGSLIAGSDMR